MSTASKLPLTAREYLELERAADIHHEFYRGEMTAMSGASFVHNRIASNLLRYIGNRLDDSPCEIHACNLRVLVDPIGYFCYPDIFLVCGTPKLLDRQHDTLLNPIVIVEVLSDSTEAYDQGEKFRRYRSLPTLRAYVLVSQKSMSVEWFERDAGGEAGSWGRRAAEGADESLVLDFLPTPVTIPLALIYARVDFPTEPRQP